MKSDKMPYIIYADIESLIRKIDGCANNPENSATTKIGGHIPCRYSISTIWAAEHIEIKHILYLGKYHMKKVCTFLRGQVKNLIDFKKKKKLLLTKEELKLHQDSKNFLKVRDHCRFTGKYRGSAHSTCNLKF